MHDIMDWCQNNIKKHFPKQILSKSDDPAILDKIENWEISSKNNKSMILSDFLDVDITNSDLADYFDKYINYLTNNTLNSHIKGVINHKF